MARDASLEAIRGAYRKLAKRHHPDLNPGDAAAGERFKKLASAHHLLADPATRARFDNGEIDAAGQETPRHPGYRDYADSAAGRRYSPGAAQQSWDGEDLGDMFSSMFGDTRRGAGSGAGRAQDQRFALTASFIDAVAGATRRLVLPDGRTLDVKIPAGTADGDILRLRGQGAQNGDALIELRVAPHAFFRREGADIRLDLPVTLAEAVLGGPVDVPTPGGTVRMRIPPGSDSLTQLRLRGRGVPAHGSGAGTIAAGDLYATLRVTVGPADAALTAFLQGWTPEHPSNPRQAMETGA